MRLQASLVVQRTAGHAFLHALQGQIVIVQPWLFLRWWRFSLRRRHAYWTQQEYK
jgi:hypothetical protein